MRALLLAALVASSQAHASCPNGTGTCIEPPVDAPVLCVPGDVVLKPDAAIAAAKRLTAAETKVAVYEAHPPLPAWAVILLVVAGAAVGGASVAIGVAVSPRQP